MDILLEKHTPVESQVMRHERQGNIRMAAVTFPNLQTDSRWKKLPMKAEKQARFHKTNRTGHSRTSRTSVRNCALVGTCDPSADDHLKMDVPHTGYGAELCESDTKRTHDYPQITPPWDLRSTSDGRVCKTADWSV